ncbi:hypothetical protein Q3G72_001836 [Acer saccharum]|nr:hypothetical protein Q3G72_001836 [Acer saccharum]
MSYSTENKPTSLFLSFSLSLFLSISRSHGPSLTSAASSTGQPTGNLSSAVPPALVKAKIDDLGCGVDVDVDVDVDDIGGGSVVVVLMLVVLVVDRWLWC